MAKMRTTRESRWYERQERWRNALAHTMVTLSGGRARLMILFVALVFVVWQLYVFAWQPLQADSNLPAGLTSVQAQLDTASLTKIRDARVGRLQHPLNLFSGAGQSFVLSPVAKKP